MGGSDTALIGGTGLGRLDGMEVIAKRNLRTPWGACSHPVQVVRFRGAECLFLPRHGLPHRIPPHRVNYRANLWALRALGARRVVAFNAVGGIGGAMSPGRLVIPDQIIDYTWGRAHTFHDDDEPLGWRRLLRRAHTFHDDDEPLGWRRLLPWADASHDGDEPSGWRRLLRRADASHDGDEPPNGMPRHVEFTHPYDPALRGELLAAAQSLGLDVAPTATYAATQGPRLESAAEIRRLAQDGCDVVGMTGMPEAGLAAELGLPYASICLVVNWAAGLGGQPITGAAMAAVIEGGQPVVADLCGRWLQSVAAQSAQG